MNSHTKSNQRSAKQECENKNLGSKYTNMDMINGSMFEHELRTYVMIIQRTNR